MRWGASLLVRALLSVPHTRRMTSVAGSCCSSLSTMVKSADNSLKSTLEPDPDSESASLKAAVDSVTPEGSPVRPGAPATPMVGTGKAKDTR